MSSLPVLQADMRNRPMTDWQTSFWVALLLSIVTCGIYWIYVLYKLIDRRLQHFERMISFRQHLIEVLKERAAAVGKGEALEQDISQLEGINLEATARDRAGDKSPVLWLVLSIVVGVIVYYVYYFLNDDFRAHEANEVSFMAKASEIMAQLEIPQQPIVPAMVVPERKFITYLILTIITCGIYGIYWIYTIIIDPNNHFDVHAAWEAQLETALMAGEQS